ncbi:hypothetical protein [Marinobacter sp. LQ44]|uniref:hypothetical protein n=1 Tax=unclassified Marinobacter TaxID=83889 RepID=UPI00078CAA80|nr:hypothetical protein [Marinobacter sp. LQ44]AMQ88559.1 hypothetical protein ASQ50_07540 [Marinobacter sp. LQ44]
MTTDKPSPGYYSPKAYNSEHLPQQKRPAPGANPAQPWFNRKADRKLPWGHTEDVAPQSYRTDYSPATLRGFEREPNNFANIDFHQRIDHERYRHATAALRTRILLFFNAFGNPVVIAFMMLPVTIGFFSHWRLSPPDETFGQMLIAFIPILAIFVGPLIACNLVPTALFKLFPRQLIKPDKGPLWELNRRTGLVTVFHYDKKGAWGKTGQPEEETAPFYEFDAYTSNELIHGGGVVHTLYLAHRYRNILIPIGTLIGKTSPEECYALWDMFQNFMDTSRPLPDIPLWEEHRANDPVTAEHDQRTNRPPRYWRDMDNDTWKQKNDEMALQVLRLNTPGRLDIMRNSWAYSPRPRRQRPVASRQATE